MTAAFGMTGRRRLHTNEKDRSLVTQYYVTDVHTAAEVDRRYPFATDRQRTIARFLPYVNLGGWMMFSSGIIIAAVAFIANSMLGAGLSLLIAVLGAVELILVMVPFAVITDRMEERRSAWLREQPPISTV